MQKFDLIHSPEFPIDRYHDVMKSEDLVPKVAERLSSIGSSDGPSVVLFDRHFISNGGDGGATFPDGAVIGVGLEGEWAGDARILMHVPSEPEPSALAAALHHAREFVEERTRNRDLEAALEARSHELIELSRIGAALASVRDYDVLLELILTKARELSRSDAGSLFLLDEIPGEGKILRWKLAQNDSIEVDFEEKILATTKKSLAGYVAVTGEPLVIDDAYDLPEGVEYSINTSFDRETGYLTRSILVLPMTNNRGDIIGVLQLINRKRPGVSGALTAETVPDAVVPYDEQTTQLMMALAGQAAVAVENNILYKSIERLFEGFVTAAVTAIEQRDPTTSGHSSRVADLTVELARVVDALDDGRFGHVTFTHDQLKEIRYASLLHDFGKVGVREKVLVKEKKLYPLQIDLIRHRFDFVIRTIEAASHAKKVEWVREHGVDGFDDYARKVDEEMAAEIAKLEEDFAFISRSNEPTVLPEGDFEYLLSLGEREYANLIGMSQKLLTPEEVKILSIRKGNLDPTERSEIESHVTHTFHFLSKIPWTRDLKRVPDYAYAHHEKLNGRGYPRGLQADEIPIQSRMMTVSDIYDALTANDRPYKKAVPTERALDILRMEMRDGLLDEGLVELFIDAKVYQRAGKLRVV